MRKVLRSFVFLAVVGVAGVLLLIAADRFGRPELIGPGLLLFALGSFGVGGDAIVRRYSSHKTETNVRTTYVGPAAVLNGVVFLILGIALAVAGVAFVLGAQNGLYRFLLARPGPAMLAAGAASTSGGAAQLLGAREWRGSVGRLLANLPARYGGLLLLLLGVALLGFGAFETVRPAAFDAWIDSLLAPLRTAPGGPAAG